MDEIEPVPWVKLAQLVDSKRALCSAHDHLEALLTYSVRHVRDQTPNFYQLFACLLQVASS